MLVPVLPKEVGNIRHRDEGLVAEMRKLVIENRLIVVADDRYEHGRRREFPRRCRLQVRIEIMIAAPRGQRQSGRCGKQKRAQGRRSRLCDPRRNPC